MPKNNFCEYFPSIENGSLGNYNDLHHLLNTSKELDQYVKQTFPLDASKSTINVKGSAELLTAYKKIDSLVGKLDIHSSLSNIAFVGLSQNNEIELSINPQDDLESLKCTGMYNSSDQFYNIFKMSNFANYLISNKLDEKIKPNIDYLLSKLPNIEKQFRLLIINNNYFLRGLTSPRYKNYDNNIIIYIMLYLLDQLNSENNTSFEITGFYLTDSDIRIFINQNTYTQIPNVGSLYFGAMVSNNEITEGRVNVELRYHFYDANKNISFGCIPDLKDAFIQIQHTSNVETAAIKFLSLKDIVNQNNIMVDYIDSLSKVKVLTKDIAYSLFKKITNSKNTDLSKSIKQSFSELYNANLLKNTYSLIETLNIVTNLTTDIDEKIALERIYYDLIKEISTN